MPRRLEALHLAFSAPGWSMGVLRPVVQVPAGSVPHIGQEIAVRYAVAAQAIGYDLARPVLQAGQQALEEAFGRRRIPPILDQDVEHHPVLVHSAPEIVQDAVDLQVHLIEGPDVARLGPSSAELPGKVSAELQAPVSDAFMGDHDAPLGQDQLHIPQAQAEYMVQPYSVADDLGRKAIAGIGGEVGRHPASLARPYRFGQRASTWQCPAEGARSQERPGWPGTHGSPDRRPGEGPSRGRSPWRVRE